jgi:hypothetical protein
MFLVTFGLIAIYVKYAKKIGKFGLAAFMIALLAQMMFAGNLFIDGFFNHYFPSLTLYCKHSCILQISFIR